MRTIIKDERRAAQAYSPDNPPPYPVDVIKAGDVITVKDIVMGGYVTSSGENVYCLIPMARPIDASDVDVSFTGLYVRQNGKYIISSDNMDVSSELTMTKRINRDVGITIILHKDGGYDGDTNNAPAAVQMSGTLTFT